MKPKNCTGNLRVLHFAGNLQADFFIIQVNCIRILCNLHVTVSYIVTIHLEI